MSPTPKRKVETRQCENCENDEYEHLKRRTLSLVEGERGGITAVGMPIESDGPDPDWFGEVLAEAHYEHERRPCRRGDVRNSLKGPGGLVG